MTAPGPIIDLLVNASGSWNTVRVAQPFQALLAQGWDVRMHEPPIQPHHAVRPSSLVIWQRPLPEQTASWMEALQLIRSRGSLLMVEWDDHPDLFPDRIRQTLAQTQCCHLRLAHALQVSCPKLAQALSPLNPHSLVVENGVDPIPPLNLTKHTSTGPVRVFLGNLNRTQEHQQLQPTLQAWLQETPQLQLVCAGHRDLPIEARPGQIEQHPLLPYEHYRQLLASCQIALLPLQPGIPQACKTPIKWLEAAAESTVVVAGPELYAPWLENDRLGLWAADGSALVATARHLAAQPMLRRMIASAAHQTIQAHGLAQQTHWRSELYRHLWRVRHSLDRRLLQRFPSLQTGPQ